MSKEINGEEKSMTKYVTVYTSLYLLHTVYIQVCTVIYIVHADMYCYILSQTSDLTLHTLFEVVYDGMTRYEPVQNKMKN